MAENSLSYLWANYIPRFLAEGIAYRDLLDLRERIKSYAEWPESWSAVGHRYEGLADEAFARGFTQTAAMHLVRAALHHFFAQFLWWEDAARKQVIHAECARTFRRAAPYLDPPQRPIEIPFQQIRMPGYLRLPKGVERPPCVILLNGLDTTKEEQLVISTLCVQRGLATVTFDGPGQGEVFPHMRLWPGYPEAIIAVLDFVEKLPEIDAACIGVIGRSLGSHYAARIAAMDSRIRAAVSWGAMFHLRNYRTIPELTRAGFLFVTGSTSIEAAEPYFSSIDLSELAPKITCPLMIVNGGADPITPPENVELMRNAVGGPVEVLFLPDSNHCIHDRPHVCRPAMADFMQRHLTG